MYDYIVIGGGLGGLSIASLLSKTGFKIGLFEKSRILGGRASCLIRDGFTLDYGIHLIRFGEHGSIPRLIKQLDYNLDILRLGDSFLYDEDGSYYLPVTMEGIMKTGYLDEEKKSEAFKILLEIINISPDEYLDTSVKEYLRGRQLSDKVRNLIRILSGMLLVIPDLEKASFGELADLIKKAVESGVGAGYPMGGWKTIIEILENSITENRGEIFSGKKVEKILFHDNNVVGIETSDDDRVEGEVIASIPPNNFIEIAPQKLLDKLDEKQLKMVPTTGVAIDIALERRIFDLHGMIIVDDPFILGLVTSGVDESVAPSGKELATFLLPIPYEEYENSRDIVMNKLEQALYKLFPEIRGNILWMRKLYLPIVDGVVPYFNQSRVNRMPINPVINGLYFVSDWVSAPGAGSDIAVNAALALYKKLR